MKKTADKKSGKSAPIKIVIPFLLLIIFCTLVYGAGMRLGGTFLSAGGFVGVFISVIPVCNLCYRQGYLDGRNTSDDGDHSVSEMPSNT